MPSPTRLIPRWTRKKPTAGASTPTIAPAAKASRMKSASRMDMRRVVPLARQVRRRAVEHDAPAHEHQALDELLDGPELVRDEEDGRVELRVQLGEQHRERLLRVDVDAGRRLVEHEQ